MNLIRAVKVKIAANERQMRNSFRLATQRGFTLLEMALGVAIIGVVGVGVIRAVDTNARAGRVLDEQVQATNLVTAFMENMRQLAYDDSANPYSSIGNGVVIPTQYNVAVNTAYSGDGVNWVSTNQSGALKLQKISISVYRSDGKLVLTNCTFRAKR